MRSMLVAVVVLLAGCTSQSAGQPAHPSTTPAGQQNSIVVPAAPTSARHCPTGMIC